MSCKTKKRKAMTNEGISNNDYVTISRDGIFVGGKPATVYHEQTIAKPEQIMQVWNMPGLEDIIELHVLQSDTDGQVFHPGNPEPAATGHYIWIRANTKYGMSPWIFRLSDIGRNDAASLCAFQCAWTLRQYPNWVNRLVTAAQANAANEKAHHGVDAGGVRQR